MKILIIFVILLAAMINSTICRNGTINFCHLYSDGTLLFFCDEIDSHQVYFYSESLVCSDYSEGKQFDYKDMNQIRFDCSFSRLSLVASFKNIFNVLILDLSNVGMVTLEKEDLVNLPSQMNNIILSHHGQR